MMSACGGHVVTSLRSCEPIQGEMAKSLPPLGDNCVQVGITAENQVLHHCLMSSQQTGEKKCATIHRVNQKVEMTATFGVQVAGTRGAILIRS